MATCTTPGCGTSFSSVLLYCPGCGQPLFDLQAVEGQLVARPTGQARNATRRFFAVFDQSRPVRVVDARHTAGGVHLVVTRGEAPGAEPQEVEPFSAAAILAAAARDDETIDPGRTTP